MRRTRTQNISSWMNWSIYILRGAYLSWWNYADDLPPDLRRAIMRYNAARIDLIPAFKDVSNRQQAYSTQDKRYRSKKNVR